MTELAEVMAQATAWVAADPDADMRLRTLQLLVAAEGGDASAIADLTERFAGRLQFGTAGLRAAVAAGPMRMNRLVVRQAAAGLGRWLLDEEAAGRLDRAAERGVVIAHDARRKSDAFALDTARVLAAMGIRSMLHPGVQPTPVLAWSITGLDAAAGVVVTASHNPPADNGYKVFLETGSQNREPRRHRHLRTHRPVRPARRSGRPGGRPSHSPPRPVVARGLRGVGTVGSAATRRGGLFRSRTARCTASVPKRSSWRSRRRDSIARSPVVEQHLPDPTFPTVSFPNPEEPGAMDLLLETAQQAGVSIALANDPDADRLGVAIPTDDGSWRKLSGDEIGWLFADHILANTEGDDRLVVTTLVSSSLLGRLAAARGVHAEETFTGFKWIGKIATERAAIGQRFVFGYEQALGYLVADRPLDKDGISAAVLMAEIAACAAADGVTLEGRLDAIADEFGRYVTAERSVRMTPADGAAWVGDIEQSPPDTIGDRSVESVSTYPEANLVRLMLDGGVRIQIRPSGTEPKVKLYGEGVDMPVAALDELLEAFAATAPDPH